MAAQQPSRQEPTASRRISAASEVRHADWIYRTGKYGMMGVFEGLCPLAAVVGRARVTQSVKYSYREGEGFLALI